MKTFFISVLLILFFSGCGNVGVGHVHYSPGVDVFQGEIVSKKNIIVSTFVETYYYGYGMTEYTHNEYVYEYTIRTEYWDYVTIVVDEGYYECGDWVEIMLEGDWVISISSIGFFVYS